MALKTDAQIEKICIKGWYGGGWGLTPREFLDLSYKTVNGQQSNTGDVVTEIRGQSLTRHMAISFWQDFCQYNQGFREGYKTLEVENEQLRARVQQAEAVSLRSGCLLDELQAANAKIAELETDRTKALDLAERAANLGINLCKKIEEAGFGFLLSQ